MEVSGVQLFYALRVSQLEEEVVEGDAVVQVALKREDVWAEMDLMEEVVLVQLEEGFYCSLVAVQVGEGLKIQVMDLCPIRKEFLFGN